jgi:pimeloyl-ACP methyl ester carboxylesterase
VVLVHGFVNADGQMLPTAERLTVDSRILVPDLRGLGDSVGPQRVLDFQCGRDGVPATGQKRFAIRALSTP